MPDPSASYDDLPYNSYAFPKSHPGHVATIAALFGMTPAPLDGARVLEVGCAGGGNLLPVASAYPGCECVGLDVSAVQIARAQEAVDAAGLRNVTLHCRGLEGLDETTAGGTFDYIIAHGVYSWVEAPVREELMALCRRLLKPQGVAYISLNVLPGSFTREIVRGMLKYHTARAATEAHGSVAAAGGAHRRGPRSFCGTCLGEALETAKIPMPGR